MYCRIASLLLVSIYLSIYKAKFSLNLGVRVSGSKQKFCCIYDSSMQLTVEQN